MADYSITAVDRRVVYSGSAGTGPYAFTFPVLATTDIAVYKDSTKLTEGSGSTQYQVTLSASNGTGSVTLNTAATSDNTITITGARTIERTTDFVTAGDLLASSLNTELDSQTIFVQQVSEDASRAIQAPVTDPTSIDMTLPLKADRLGKFLSFNSSTGNPEVTVSTSDVTGAAASATAAASSATAAASSESSASASAGTATTQAGIATTKAAEAAASAASAAVTIASQAEAEAGTNNANIMTPLRTKQAVDGYGLLSANNLSDVGSAATARTNLGLGTAATLTAGTSANNAVQLDGSGALPAVSGAALTGIASGGTVNLVADGSITAGKPVAITSDGKVKQISATGYTMTESLGSTIATSSRNPDYQYLVYDPGNDEVISGMNIGTSSYFARIPLDASMNTTFTGELTYAHGGVHWLAGIGMVYNPAIDRIWCGPFRLSDARGYLLRNNSGTLSGSASVSFGTASPYGSVDVNPATGAMYIAGTAGATTGVSGMGFADTSISEEVQTHYDVYLGSMNYGHSYSYYAAMRHIPGVGLIFMRQIYDYGIEYQFLTSEQWDKDQVGAFNSSSLTGGSKAKYSNTPTASPDQAGPHILTTAGAGQYHYPLTSQWHPWAKRLIMLGRDKDGGTGTISTVSFESAMVNMSYGVGITGVPDAFYYHGPHCVPIPGTNAFAFVYYDSSDSNKLSYRVIDIKLGRNASEDDFVVSAARQIDTNSHGKCCAVWDQNRNAMVVSSNHSSEQRFYGVKPQLAVSNARNFIGFASSSVSDTQTLTVHLKGAVNENQSNLVVGRRYLVGHDGNLIEADNNPGKSQGMPFTGTAIAATKIAVGV